MKTELHSLAIQLGTGGKRATQQDLAAYFGVTQKTVSQWVTGRFKPSQPHRSLLLLSLKIGDIVRAVTGDPGTDGPGRLTSTIGQTRTIELLGDLQDTVCARRLATIFEAVPGLVGGAAVNPVPSFLMPATAPRVTVVVPAAGEETARALAAAKAAWEARQQ